MTPTARIASVATPWVLLALLFLVGCIEVSGTTRIEADGSGAFSEVVVVDIEAAAALRAAFKERAASAGEAEDPRLRSLLTTLDPAERLKDLSEANGLTAVTSKAVVNKAKGTRTYSRTARFANLEALFASDIIEDMEGSLRPARGGKAWALTIRHVFDDDELDAAGREKVLKVRRKLLAPFASHLTGFRIQRTVTFPTRVLDTNGTLDKDGRTVRWSVDSEAIVDPQRLRQTVTFAASDALSLKAFGEQTALREEPEPKKAKPEKAKPKETTSAPATGK